MLMWEIVRSVAAQESQKFSLTPEWTLESCNVMLIIKA